MAEPHCAQGKCLPWSVAHAESLPDAVNGNLRVLSGRGVKMARTDIHHGSELCVSNRVTYGRHLLSYSKSAIKEREM